MIPYETIDGLPYDQFAKTLNIKDFTSTISIQ